jgi:hypothetical protein
MRNEQLSEIFVDALSQSGSQSFCLADTAILNGLLTCIITPHMQEDILLAINKTGTRSYAYTQNMWNTLYNTHYILLEKVNAPVVC